MKRLDLNPKIQQLGINNDKLTNSLIEYFMQNEETQNADEIEIQSMINTVKRFFNKVKSKLEKHNRHYEIFQMVALLSIMYMHAGMPA